MPSCCCTATTLQPIRPVPIVGPVLGEELGPLNGTGTVVPDPAPYALQDGTRFLRRRCQCGGPRLLDFRLTPASIGLMPLSLLSFTCQHDAVNRSRHRWGGEWVGGVVRTPHRPKIHLCPVQMEVEPDASNFPPASKACPCWFPPSSVDTVCLAPSRPLISLPPRPDFSDH